MNRRGHWLSLIILLILLILVPRGCTREKIKGGIDQSGNPAVEIAADSSFLGPAISVLAVARGEFIKKDFAFVVYYEHKLEMGLSGVPEIPGETPKSAPLSIIAPGEIIYANANLVEKNKATWLIKLGENYDIKIVSRKIRWWLIGLTIILLGFAGYTRFFRKESSQQTSEDNNNS